MARTKPAVQSAKAAVESAFDADPQRSVGYLIRDSARLILAKLQLLLEPHDVTLGQYFVLRELWEREGATQRELSARIGIGEQSAVATIDAMEQRDLVVRVRSKQDRRKTHIYLTARGRGLREELLSYAAQVINTATDGFAPGEVDVLRALLAKLKARLES
jgi:MarR family transcriptional regulator, organic hydroperoxide resistance regulator